MNARVYAIHRPAADGSGTETVMVEGGAPEALPSLDIPQPTEPMHIGSTFLLPAKGLEPKANAYDRALRHLRNSVLALGVCLLAMALLGSLSGCGGGDPEDLEVDGVKTTQPVDCAVVSCR